MIDIEAIRKRLEAATQRPLILGPILRGCHCDDSNATFLARVSRAALEVIYDGEVVNLGEDEEADFIYHAPTDIAYLLERVEELEAVKHEAERLWAAGIGKEYRIDDLKKALAACEAPVKGGDDDRRED